MAREFNPHGNRTADGVLITVGLAVFDYDYRPGVVVADAYDGDYGKESDHWYTVLHANGGTKEFNGERLNARMFGRAPQVTDVEVEAFHQARPYYVRADIEYIAAHKLGESIPFCWECKDWHHPDEGHSTLG